MIARLFSMFFLSSALLCVGASHAADSPRELTWPDLQPAKVIQLEEQAYEATRAINEMSEKDQEIYELVREELSIRKRIELGFIDEKRLDEKTKASLANPPSKRYPEALAFWENIDSLQRQLQKLQKQPNLALNGKSIRMPGYLLPLEFTEDKISEFLLVPYIGACMHAPTPPANQMVFVTTKEPFSSERLYQAIWVEGELKAEQGSHKLSLVDGTNEVQAGYTLRATQIEPYKR